MSTQTPDTEVIKGFNLSGKPELLSGGQGESYRVGNAVLKPVDHSEEASWVAELNSSFTSNAFRVPKPIKAKDDSWVFNGWIASEFIEGTHKKESYDEAITVSQAFHKAIKDIPKPSFFETRNNVWAVADRIAWSEQTFPDFTLTNKYFQQITSLLKPIKLPSQLIHGDWGLGNLLFDKDNTPVVIDFSPYWRPADFPIAIMIVDALAYENAKASIVHLCSNIDNFDQLLLRALTRRICEYIGHQNHPDNTLDRTKDIQIHLQIFDTLFKENNLQSITRRI